VIQAEEDDALKRNLILAEFSMGAYLLSTNTTSPIKIWSTQSSGMRAFFVG
jgi:hypothetical protein